MDESKKIELERTLLRLRQTKNDMIGNRHMKAQYLAAGLLHEYLLYRVYRCYTLLQTQLQSPILVDIHIQCLALINSFLEDSEEAKNYLRGQKDFFDILVRIFKGNLENPRALDLVLRTLRNGLLKNLLKADVFLQVLVSWQCCVSRSCLRNFRE